MAGQEYDDETQTEQFNAALSALQAQLSEIERKIDSRLPKNFELAQSTRLEGHTFAKSKFSAPLSYHCNV